ncbi:MAG: acetylxylan esterase [Bacteroidales bacterium]|nr:acetylxylan esterase [Bacteroidales bacterium]
MLLLAFLGIKSFAQFNYDEDKIPDYTLPEILVSDNGKKIETAEEWKSIRRPEILKRFEESVYGSVLKDSIEVKFTVLKNDPQAMCGKAIQKIVMVSFIKGQDTVRMELLIYLPADVTKPVPVFLGLNFYGNQAIHPDTSIPISKGYVFNSPEFTIFNNTATHTSRGVNSSSWPVERILERGFGLATIFYGDIDPDFDDGFKNGIHKLMDYSDSNNAIQPSSISAWAFGLSTAMDYFETDKDINQNQVALFGHSRLGKTALWAGANDQRFAIVISNNSGCGGAALSRRKFGETVERINTHFPHWFSKNFHAFNDKENELPVDQHMLLGLIAPRSLYVASAEQDKWADPKGELLGLYYAGPVYNLFGLESFTTDTMPEINTPIRTGNLGYHIRSGRHNITRFDWEQYLDFADNIFTRKDE